MSDSPPRAQARLPGVFTVFCWELRKLRKQKRTYSGLLVSIGLPIAFALSVAFSSQSRHGDIPFRSQDHASGLAVPLVVLGFGSLFLLPLIAALVAGDIVSAEDHNGTLKTLLTMPLRRSQVLAAKFAAASAYVIAALTATGVVGTLAGLLASGYHPLVGLSGGRVSAAHALGLVAASFALFALPLLALAAIAFALSVITRNSAAAIVAATMLPLLLRIVPLLPHTDALAPYLLQEQFSAWQGLWQSPIDWTVIVRSGWVSAGCAVPALAAATFEFARRDVTG